MQKFAEGASLESLGHFTLTSLLPLCFLPCSERAVESKHAGVATGLSGKKRNRSAVTVSLASGRLRELEVRLKERPGMLSELVACMAKVSNPRAMALEMGILYHPQIQELLSRASYIHPTQFQPVLQTIVYHCDVEQQYRKLSDMAHEHAAPKQNKKRPSPTPTVWEDMLQTHLVEKLADCVVGHALSFSSHRALRAKLSPLLSYLQTPEGATVPIIPSERLPSRRLAAEASTIYTEEALLESVDIPGNTSLGSTNTSVSIP